MQTDTLRINRIEKSHHLHLPRHLFSGAMIFLAAYFTTVTVNAGQAGGAPPAAPDVVQLNDNGPAVVTGTVIEAEDDYVLIDSAGTRMRITLEEVNLEDDAGILFKQGMDVTVEGEMKGHDFGTPVIAATSITAREPASP